MEPEVSHDKIIWMILISMMALIEDQKVNFLHMHESVHEQVIELVGYHYQNILLSEFASPLFGVSIVIALFLTSMIATYAQICVSLNCRSLLLNQILCWCNKHDLRKDE